MLCLRRSSRDESVMHVDGVSRCIECQCGGGFSTSGSQLAVTQRSNGERTH